MNSRDIRFFYYIHWSACDARSSQSQWGHKYINLQNWSECHFTSILPFHLSKPIVNLKVITANRQNKSLFYLKDIARNILPLFCRMYVILLLLKEINTTLFLRNNLTIFLPCLNFHCKSPLTKNVMFKCHYLNDNYIWVKLVYCFSYFYYLQKNYT